MGDGARDELMKEMPGTGEAFIAEWVERTKKKLTENGGMEFLPKATAARLFNAMVQEGGGLPLPMVQAMGGLPPKQWQEVERACEEHFPDRPPPSSGGGGGGSWGGKGGSSGGGCGGGGGYGGGMQMGMGMGNPMMGNPMMQQMQAMMM